MSDLKYCTLLDDANRSKSPRVQSSNFLELDKFGGVHHPKQDLTTNSKKKKNVKHFLMKSSLQTDLFIR